jgi:hypothetical protein
MDHRRRADWPWYLWPESDRCHNVNVFKGLRELRFPCAAQYVAQFVAQFWISKMRLDPKELKAKTVGM